MVALYDAAPEVNPTVAKDASSQTGVTL